MSIRACVTVSFAVEFQNRGHPAPGERHSWASCGCVSRPWAMRARDLPGAFEGGQPHQLPPFWRLTFSLTLPGPHQAPSARRFQKRPSASARRGSRLGARQGCVPRAPGRGGCRAERVRWNVPPGGGGEAPRQRRRASPSAVCADGRGAAASRGGRLSG